MLPDHLIHELRYIEIYTKRRFPNLRTGTYQSMLRGPGFEFDEHRLYRAGDDVRRIDWNVTARMQVPYVRETHADSELNVVIAVDVTKSMEYGTRAWSKKERQLLLAASLIYSSLADQVNTGFMMFSDKVLNYYPPRHNRARAWKFLEELWSSESVAGESCLLPAIDFLGTHFRQEGIIFLISDYMTNDDLANSRALNMLALKHDIVAVVVEDPNESHLPGGNSSIELMDVESGTRKLVGLGNTQRELYAQTIQKHHQGLINAFYRAPMDYVFARSDKHVVEPLLKMFSTRKRS
ncbi:MAG: hypothetical protein ACI9XC_000638 [Gammaproteobacteria bacterium]|jgi:uncharacterized protein (DUF58 family)